MFTLSSYEDQRGKIAFAFAFCRCKLILAESILQIAVTGTAARCIKVPKGRFTVICTQRQRLHLRLRKSQHCANGD